MYLHVNKPKTRKDEPESAVTMTGRHREVLDQVLRVFGVASDHDLFSVQAEFAAMSHISNPYGDGYASVRIVDMLAQ